jgi:hypothetical protein
MSVLTKSPKVATRIKYPRQTGSADYNVKLIERPAFADTKSGHYPIAWKSDTTIRVCSVINIRVCSLKNGDHSLQTSKFSRGRFRNMSIYPGSVWHRVLRMKFLLIVQKIIEYIRCKYSDLKTSNFVIGHISEWLLDS